MPADFPCQKRSMAQTAKIQFGDNSFRRYSREYLLTDFKFEVARSHNVARPDGTPYCDWMDLTVVVPGREDLNLYEWYVNGGEMSGRILIDEENEILFEDGVCFSIKEDYHIDVNRRRSVRLLIAVRSLEVEGIQF